MGPAGTTFDPWQAVVPLITVGFQIPAVAFQEFLCLAVAKILYQLSAPVYINQRSFIPVSHKHRIYPFVIKSFIPAFNRK